ncbi:hypothetical protein DP117_03980 [Brasilonema sp. UFV-L1]|nr:hypothetical protein [Brasilonema sp. UFV-L1]
MLRVSPLGVRKAHTEETSAQTTLGTTVAPQLGKLAYEPPFREMSVDKGTKEINNFLTVYEKL